MKLKIKFIVQLLILCCGLFAGYFLLSEDFQAFMQWWFVVFLLGIIFFPLSSLFFSRFYDKGYLFSKTFGIAVSGYILWVLSSIKVLKFTSTSCLIVIGLCVICNGFLLIMKKRKNKKKRTTLLNEQILSEFKEKCSLFITEELMFFLIFLVWTYIRGFKPEAYGTEKFMDYGFMTTMMRTEFFPSVDLWFAGEKLNYYYVGQYIATYLTKLSFVTVNVGYNLMLMMIASFGFVLPYSIVMNVTKNSMVHGKKSKVPMIAGLLAGAGVSLASNLHFVLFYWIVPMIQDIFEVETKSSFWFPDSTRYIGYHPDTTDKTIHEFPNYSFVLGDLHAHVINIIFVLTMLAILYGWILYRKNMKEKLDSIQEKTYPVLWKELCNPYICAIGFFIGLFHTTNFWDFPIYYVVAGAIILYTNLVIYDFSIRCLKITAYQGIIIMVLAKLIALLFTMNFDQISTNIYITESVTPLYQLVILWGLPVVLVISLLVALIKENKNINRVEEHQGNSFQNNELSLQNKRTSFGDKFRIFILQLDFNDAFVLLIGLCAIGLVLMPEIVYVKDIYSGDYKRANTMFKLTYQAFILFGICAGYILTKFLVKPKFYWQLKVAIVGLLLFLSSCWYTKVSVSLWYGNIFLVENYKGLDAAAFMEDSFYEDYLATNWLNENIEGTPVVLEVNGDSYSDYQRVSVVTGLPTVVGWYVHEWLWRGNVQVVDDRIADVKDIYTSTDLDLITSYIAKYQVAYIYIGKLEYEKYEDINIELLTSLGSVVYSHESEGEDSYETMIIKIDPVG